MINVLPKDKDTKYSPWKPQSSERQVHNTKKIEQVYSLRNAQTIGRFLQQHPHLIDFLLESYPYIEKYFGTQTKVFLDIFLDPELAEEQLLASIETSLSVDEALTLLNKLDDEWFLPRLDSVDNLFNFHLEAA